MPLSCGLFGGGKPQFFAPWRRRGVLVRQAGSRRQNQRLLAIRRHNKPALGNPLPALSRSRRVATNLNLNRRGASGSGLPGLDVRQQEPKHRDQPI
jgi:hypothetical protein